MLPALLYSLTGRARVLDRAWSSLAPAIVAVSPSVRMPSLVFIYCVLLLFVCLPVHTVAPSQFHSWSRSAIFIDRAKHRSRILSATCILLLCRLVGAALTVIYSYHSGAAAAAKIIRAAVALICAIFVLYYKQRPVICGRIFFPVLSCMASERTRHWISKAQHYVLGIQSIQCVSITQLVLRWLASGTARGLSSARSPAAFLAAFQHEMAKPRAPYATLARSRAGMYPQVRHGGPRLRQEPFLGPSCLSVLLKL